MNTSMIDKLAEFCGIKQPGQPIEIPLLDCVYVLNDTASYWNPLEDERHCRQVMERFYEVASPHQKIDFYQPFVDDDIDGLGAFAERLLLATPAEKCAAVLKVLEDA